MSLQIREWLDDGIESDYDYMLVVCHIMSTEPFPDYVAASRLAEVVDIHHRQMNKVLEIYDLKADLEVQIRTPRSWTTTMPRSV